MSNAERVGEGRKPKFRVVDKWDTEILLIKGRPRLRRRFLGNGTKGLIGKTAHVTIQIKERVR